MLNVLTNVPLLSLTDTAAEDLRRQCVYISILAALNYFLKAKSLKALIYFNDGKTLVEWFSKDHHTQAFKPGAKFRVQENDKNT